MKSVLISINPKWCELIASGKKTVEVRKTRPKLETPFKVYIYCTKDNTFAEKTLRGFDDNGKAIYYKANKGKVVGEFVCDKIQEITYTQIYNFGRYKDVCEAETRLDFYALDDYLKQKNGYGWHITDLVVYDEPKALSEFEKPCEEFEFSTVYSPTIMKVRGRPRFFERPPQSWCYVESEDKEKGKQMTKKEMLDCCKECSYQCTQYDDLTEFCGCDVADMEFFGRTEPKPANPWEESEDTE